MSRWNPGGPSDHFGPGYHGPDPSWKHTFARLAMELKTLRETDWRARLGGQDDSPLYADNFDNFDNFGGFQ